MVIPLFKVLMADDVEDFVNPVLHSGYIGEGSKVVEFEKVLSSYLRNPNIVTVNSGTSALMLALKLAGIGYGDKVLSTPMTCLATNLAILAVGAIPVWADVGLDGMLIPEKVEKKVKDCKAIMCMDMGGSLCAIEDLMMIGKKYGIPVIEDACQAFGSIYKDQMIGSIADYVAFSFQAVKFLTTGDGGALIVNNGNVERARLMRWFGLDRTLSQSVRSTQDPPVLGYKWHLTDIAASIGLANIKIVQSAINRTRKNVNIIDEVVRKQKRIKPTPVLYGSNYWLYTVLCNDVKAFIQYMTNYGIECSKVHCRNDTKTIFENYRCLLPGVNYFDSHSVCIPVGWWISEKECEEIAWRISQY